MGSQQAPQAGRRLTFVLMEVIFVSEQDIIKFKNFRKILYIYYFSINIYMYIHRKKSTANLQNMTIIDGAIAPNNVWIARHSSAFAISQTETNDRTFVHGIQHSFNNMSSQNN
jgi:hypothetical protein